MTRLRELGMDRRGGRCGLIRRLAAATNGDAGSIKKLSAAGNLFVPGTGDRSLVVRVASAPLRRGTQVWS
jgi:hypothetical protein